MGWAEPRVVIIGAGAVGCFVGARLALAGVNVTLVGRHALVGAVQASGLRLVEPEGEQVTPPLRAFTDLAEAFRTGVYDLGIVTAKAYDTAAIAGELEKATRKTTPLLSLQNGVGNEDTLAESFGAERVVAGALETPLSLPRPGVVQAHRARYRVGIAPVGSQPLARAVTMLLQSARLTVTLFDNYRRLKWSKLLLNLPANAACAILNWTPGRCMAQPLTATLEARAWQEAFRVLAGLGIRPVDLAGYPLGLLASIAPGLPSAVLARAMARTVSGGRGSKMPSFQVALAAGKPSEVAWLNGAVARYGERSGVHTPVNATLTSILSNIAAHPETWSDWQDQPKRLAAFVAEATQTSKKLAVTKSKK